MSTTRSVTEVPSNPSNEEDPLFYWQIRVARQADELVRTKQLDTCHDRAVWLAAEEVVFNLRSTPACAAPSADACLAAG